MTAQNDVNHHEIEPPPCSEDVCARSHKRSLRSKLVLSLAVMFAGFMLLDELVRQRVIQPVFSNLEQDGALRDTHRVIAAIDVELDHLLYIAKQRAIRFEGIELLPKLENESTSDASAWPSESVYWAAVVGSDHSWQWIHHGPDIDQLKQQFNVDKELFPRIALHADTSGTEANDAKPFDGLTAAPNRTIHAYAGARILDDAVSSEADDASPLQHYLVVGKAFDENMLAQLRKRTQVDFSIQVYRSPRASQQLDIWEADESRLVVEAPLKARNNEIVANLFVQVPRDVMQKSRATTAVAHSFFVCGIVASLLIMMLKLNRIIVNPITAIREHTERIAQHGLDAGSLSIGSNDEIGQLASAFDHMKNRLTDTQLRLADASHAAGMSQVADTVIHNVGNVLTNVNSLIDTATDRIDGLRISPLEKLASRLRESDDDALQAATPDYLHKLATELEKDQSTLSELLKTLHDNVQHIHDVIRDQRRHTVTTIDKQRFSLSETVNEAIRCCQARLNKDDVAVTLAKDSDTEVETDRSLLLQIVINVIGNARQAMKHVEYPTLDIVMKTTSAKTVQLSFTDNGCGMLPEVLDRIFDAHFTTRQSGSGLGLHFCAIALKRLDGQITASSDGLGLGSTFTIELPCAHQSSQPLQRLGAAKDPNIAELTS